MERDDGSYVCIFQIQIYDYNGLCQQLLYSKFIEKFLNNISRQMKSPLTQIKFWNKKQTTSDSPMIITDPFHLDNYFNSQQSKCNTINMHIPIQFNRINQQESLQNVLSKKLRGIKLSVYAEKLIKKEVYFIDKQTKERFSISIEELFNYYLSYKAQEVQKAYITNELATKIIKPFLRIYMSVLTNEYKMSMLELKNNPNKKIINKELSQLFRQILKNISHEQTDQLNYSQQQSFQQYYTSTKNNNNPKISLEADKIIKTIQQRMTSSQSPPKSHQLSLSQHKKAAKKKKKLYRQIKSRVNTGLKIKQESNENNQFQLQENGTLENRKDVEDNDDLCYQLGLLIQHTNNILRPHIQFNEDDINYENTKQ